MQAAQEASDFLISIKQSFSYPIPITSFSTSWIVQILQKSTNTDKHCVISKLFHKIENNDTEEEIWFKSWEICGRFIHSYKSLWMNEQLIEFCPPSSTYIHKNNRFRNFRHNALIDISQSKEEIIMDIKSEVKLQIDLFLDLMPLILEMAFSVKLEIFRVIIFGWNDYPLYIFDFLNNCYFLFPLSHCLQFKCDSSIDGFVPCEDFPILDASYAPEIDAPDKNNLCENKFNLFLNKYDSTKANTRFKEVLLAELRNIYMSHDNPKTDPLHGKREEL